MLRLQRFDNPVDFEKVVRPFLMTSEAEHNLMLGVLGHLVSPNNRYKNVYMATVSEKDVVGAAIRTPPFGLLLSRIDDDRALDLIADDAPGDLSGVLGDPQFSREFARLWRLRTNTQSTKGMSQRIYEASFVNEVEVPSGHFRRANDNDTGLLRDWLSDFHTETDLHEPVDLRETITRGLASGSYYFWCDPDPVSLAGHANPTPNGMRIGPVHTPTKFRRKGYATACVAKLTAQILRSGRRFCFLYTDLSNPDSNSIYQKIGYRAVCDAQQWLFEQSGGGGI